MPMASAMRCAVLTCVQLCTSEVSRLMVDLLLWRCQVLRVDVSMPPLDASIALSLQLQSTWRCGQCTATQLRLFDSATCMSIKLVRRSLTLAYEVFTELAGRLATDGVVSGVRAAHMRAGGRRGHAAGSAFQKSMGARGLADISEEMQFELQVLEVVLDYVTAFMEHLTSDIEAVAYPGLDAIVVKVIAQLGFMPLVSDSARILKYICITA